MVGLKSPTFPFSEDSMSTSLSRPSGDLGIDTWHMMKEQAGMLVKTGFLPSAIKTAEQAVAIMLKGKELGIPSMYALSNIAVIQGKPVANAELMLALIYRDHGDRAILFLHSGADECTIAYRRRSWTEAQSYSFTIEDARKAGLLGNQTWQKYPAAMLRARCVSAVARMAFPDSIGGMYTPEELGAQVVVNDEGSIEIVDVTPPQIVERQPQLTIEAPPHQQTINASLKRKATPEDAQRRFRELFPQFKTWQDVCQFLGWQANTPGPETVDEWKETVEFVRAALAEQPVEAAA